MQTFVKYFVIFILTLLTYSFFLYYPINMYRKSFFFVFALFIIVPFFCFSESLAQCDFLYNSFIRDGYSPKKQSLDNTNNYNFPYNIILEPENVSQPSTKIFIKIEEALSIVTELEKIVEFATVVCTANDSSFLTPEYAIGTSVALGSFSQDTAKSPIIVISVNTNEERFWTITPGSKGYLAPSYCYSKIKKALEKEDIISFLQDGSFALYKLNLVKSDPVLSTILSNEYPALKLNIPLVENKHIAKVIKNFATDYEYDNPKNKDVNYDNITIFSKNFTISEFSLTLIFLSVVAFSLFSICVLSFMFGKQKKLHKKTMLKYWYIAPLFLAIALICLFIAQIITKKIFSVWEVFPHYAIIIKLIFACLIFSLFYILRKFLKIPSRAFVYSYLLNIVSLVNFFVFSALDLPLLLLFGLEFIIIYVSQGFKKTSLLTIATIFLLIPFFPTIYGIFAKSDSHSLLPFINSNLFINLVLSLLILPFAFMIMRLILSVKRKIHIKRQIIKLIIACSLIVGFSIVTSIFSNNLMKKYNYGEHNIVFQETSIDLASFDLSFKEDIGFRSNVLKFASIGNVFDYEIKIFSDFAFPIYSSNYPFDFFETQNAVQFNLPENPPETFTMEFISEAKTNFYIEIKVYAFKEDKKYTKDFYPTIYTRTYLLDNFGKIISNETQEENL